MGLFSSQEASVLVHPRSVGRPSTKTPEERKAARVAYIRAWHAAHPESTKASWKRWALKNREKLRARDKARVFSPAERIRRALYLKKWHALHPTYSKEHRQKNPERARKNGREWYHANREQALKWHHANKEKRRVNFKRWCAQNPAKVNAREKQRRARQCQAKGKISAEQLQARVEFYGNRCAYCGGPYEHLDHVIPLARGGVHLPANIRPACEKCNLSKGAKLLREWRGAKCA